MMENKEQMKPFLRVLNTDLVGEKPIATALLKVKGISFSMANAICRQLNLDLNKQAGLISDEEAEKIEGILTSNKLPKWLFNRRKDEENGIDAHLFSADLKFAKDNDIKKLRRIKVYRGVRH